MDRLEAVPQGYSAEFLHGSNRRTRRYAVVAHDQAIEYTDKRYGHLQDRIQPLEERADWALKERDELFERLQAVEQYIRVDHAINNSFRYANLELVDDRHRRIEWRRFRDAALARIGRIKDGYTSHE